MSGGYYDTPEGVRIFVWFDRDGVKHENAAGFLESDELIEARTRLAAIRLLVAHREAAAEKSFSQMAPGVPFPAIVTTGEIRVILEENA